MDLLIIRHADAEMQAESDFARDLTPKGRKQAERLADFLVSHHIQPDHLIFSPLHRARQTAEILQQRCQAALFRDDNTLSCGMAPEDACSLLQHECPDAECVALVGHEPDLSTLCAYLTGMRDVNLVMKKCSCAMLDLEHTGQGGAYLSALVPPKLLTESSNQ